VSSSGRRWEAPHGSTPNVAPRSELWHHGGMGYLDMKKLARPLALARDFEGAIRLLVSHAETHPDDAADALAHAGELAFEVNTAPQPPVEAAATLVFQGDRGRAEALFRAALERSPEHPQALYGLARALPEKSIERIERLTVATTARPTYLGLLDLGDSLRSVGRDYRAAYAAYSRAHELDPRQRTIYMKLADICTKLGKPEAATEWRAKWQQRRERDKPSVKGQALEVVVDTAGWTRCPACNRRFGVDNAGVFADGRHRCGQALTLRPASLRE